MNPTIERVNAAADAAMQSPAMHRILMDVDDAAVVQKIVDAFIEGVQCGITALGDELTAKRIAKFKGARSDGRPA